MADERKPTLIYVIKYSVVGGASFHVLQLMEHFRHSYDVQLLVGDWDYVATEAQRRGFKVDRVQSMGMSASPVQFVRLILDLMRIFRQRQPVLVHGHSPLAGVACRWACFFEHIPCLTTIHSWNFAPGMPWGRRITAWLLEFVVAKLRQPIITVSEFDRRLGIRFRVVRASQIHVIHNGIPSRLSSRPDSENVGPVKLVMVARQDVRKCHDQFLQALTTIDLPYIVYFIGDGPHRMSNEVLADRLGLADRVRFMGQRLDVADLLEKMDIAVLVSQAEGLPLAILEAMRAGLPVIATDVGGVSEAVIDGKTGYLVPMNNVSSLSERLQELISNSQLRKAFGLMAKSQFESKFVEDAMFSRMQDVYTLIFKGSRV